MGGGERGQGQIRPGSDRRFDGAMDLLWRNAIAHPGRSAGWGRPGRGVGVARSDHPQNPQSPPSQQIIPTNAAIAGTQNCDNRSIALRRSDTAPGAGRADAK